MEAKNLSDIIEMHHKWMLGLPGGERANLRGANLQGADLRKADLRKANLREANLRWANLRLADLQGANLGGADLRGVDLRKADLQEANLRWANLRLADLQGADLRRADLRKADLWGANLQEADLPSPSMVLSAYWSHLPDKITIALMRLDCSACPDGVTRFDRWANGGPCPYTNARVERVANFTESASLWRTHGWRNPPSLYRCMSMVLDECCPGWRSEEGEG